MIPEEVYEIAELIWGTGALEEERHDWSVIQRRIQTATTVWEYAQSKLT